MHLLVQSIPCCVCVCYELSSSATVDVGKWRLRDGEEEEEEDGGCKRKTEVKMPLPLIYPSGDIYRLRVWSMGDKIRFVCAVFSHWQVIEGPVSTHSAGWDATRSLMSLHCGKVEARGAVARSRPSDDVGNNDSHLSSKCRNGCKTTLWNSPTLHSFDIRVCKFWPVWDYWYLPHLTG